MVLTSQTPSIWMLARRASCWNFIGRWGDPNWIMRRQSRVMLQEEIRGAMLESIVWNATQNSGRSFLKTITLYDVVFCVLEQNALSSSFSQLYYFGRYW